MSGGWEGINRDRPWHVALIGGAHDIGDAGSVLLDGWSD